MECNCNNNNSNGGVIPWVRGNRLPLIICVYENVVTQEQVGDSTLTVNEMTRVPYTIQDNDTVTVIMKSGFRQVEMPFTTDGNKVMVTDNGELPTGAYTVEVTIERGDGARGRWQETRQVRIYENTSDAQLGEMYSIDADLFFYAKGDTGTGIADITNNPDGTLTITMTDGTSYTTDALKGDKGDKGDTGERGVSIVEFDVTGQTDVSVIYTVTFSDDTTQEVAVPKGPQGDTGLTGNGISTTTLNSDYTLTIAYTDGTTYTTPSIRGAQGAQGVSVIGFTQTGETATNTMYNLVFSDGRTQSVAIPKGAKGAKGDTGNPGPQGAQGPKGDTVTATDYTLYNVQGSDSQGAMSQDATTKAISAQTGYYTCGTLAGTPEKVVTVESGNLYKRTLGGHFKVQMTNKNTAASGVTLQIGSETATVLWYNGAAASATNTWDAGEVISVYYDGSVYQASNAQGGGGKAEKIKYDNSKSILPTENVQDTLDGITDELVFEGASEKSTSTTRNWIINNDGNYVATSGYQCFMSRVYPGEKYEIKANSEKNAYYAFMASNPSSVTSNTPANFVTGYEERYAIEPGKTGKFTIPDVTGTIYLYIQKQTSSVFTPEYVHKLTTIKEKIDNDIYRKDSVVFTTLTGLNLSYPDCVIIEGGSSAYTILYREVSIGDKFHVTASNDTDKRLVIGFTTEIPAVDVQVVDTIDLKTTSVDEYVESTINGYLVIFKNSSYFTDLNVSEINGELADTVVENKIIIDGVEKKVNGYTPFMASATAVKQLLNATSLKWSVIATSSSTKYKSRIEPISQYIGKVMVITRAGGAANVAILSDNSNTAGDFGHFSRPWEKFIKLSDDCPSVRILLTENDRYLYYQVTNTSGTDITPVFKIEESDQKTFDTVENYSLTLDRTDYNLDEKDEETNPDGIEIVDLWIDSSTNAWNTTTSNVKGFFLDISSHKGGYLFISNYNEGCYAAFLRDNYNCDTNGALPNYSAGTGRTSINVGFRMKYNIPTDANMVFFSYANSSQEPRYPAGVFAMGKDIGGSNEVAKTLDIGQINLQKKASQYLNVKWTAKANIGSMGSQGHTSTYMEAGDKSGMIYSSCQQYDRSVGHDVSLRTFMTAANNPYSLLYTEDPHTGSTDADYDMDYYATYGATVFSFFGMVCSRFACYASGMDEWSTSFFEWLWKQGYLTKIQDQSAQGVEIGDYIWIPGHVVIVTNYVKSGGVVTSVTTTEAVTPVVRIKTRTASEFNNWLNAVSGGGNSNGPGYIYRNNEIYKNVVYEASPFVAIDDEVPQEYQYNNDICTYAGDYAAFRLKGENDTRNDYKVWLNYNLGDTPSRQWTGITLYKETYNDSNVLSLVWKATYNDVDFTKHKYLIPSTDLTEVGKYRACLTDGTVESEPTYFEIIGAKVTYTRDGDAVTVNYGYEENNAPTKIIVEAQNGSHRAVRTLSQGERDNGTVTFNPKALNAKQVKTALDYNDAYIKAFFQGEYGRVTNEPLKIDYNS